MKFNIIKSALFCLFLALTNSCKTASADPSTLPKDISERPADEDSQKYDQAQLDQLRSALEGEISREECTDASVWAFAPLGSKACGGPVSYIAYPKNRAESILPKIEDFNKKNMEYNKKYNIVSDCILTAEPKSVKCHSGKPVLIYP